MTATIFDGEFSRRFHHHARLNGTAYLLASEARVAREKAELAQAQGFAAGPQAFTHKPFEEWAPMVYGPSQVCRIKKYLDLDSKTQS